MPPDPNSADASFLRPERERQGLAAIEDAVAKGARLDFKSVLLQRFHKPSQAEAGWFDFAKNAAVPMKGRVRLRPYYFVIGEGDAARPQLGGVLTTIVPADKKTLPRTSDAVLARCTDWRLWMDGRPYCVSR